MKATREERAIELLRRYKAANVNDGWCPLPELQREAGAQHSARLNGLRKKGFVIHNKMKDVGGDSHSWYKLISEPNGLEQQPTKLPVASESLVSPSLFSASSFLQFETGRAR